MAWKYDGSGLHLKLCDDPYSDNSGSFTVKVQWQKEGTFYTCHPNDATRCQLVTGCPAGQICYGDSNSCGNVCYSYITRYASRCSSATACATVTAAECARGNKTCYTTGDVCLKYAANDCAASTPVTTYTTYKCSGSPNYSCTPTVCTLGTDGCYNSLDSCSSSCNVQALSKYKCSSYQCQACTASDPSCSQNYAECGVACPLESESRGCCIILNGFNNPVARYDNLTRAECNAKPIRWRLQKVGSFCPGKICTANYGCTNINYCYQSGDLTKADNSCPANTTKCGGFYCKSGEECKSYLFKKFCSATINSCPAAKGKLCAAGQRNTCCPLNSVCGKSTILGAETAVCLAPGICTEEMSSYCGKTDDGKLSCCTAAPNLSCKNDGETGNIPVCQTKDETACIAVGQKFCQGTGDKVNFKRCCPTGTCEHHSNGLPFCND